MSSPAAPAAPSAAVPDPPDAALPAVPGLRPQSVLLTFFGDHVADDGGLVAARGVLDLLDRVGVGEAAGRATLARMVRRGHLHREVRGRKAYYGLTGQGADLVLGGRSRVLHGSPLDAGTGADAGWTMVVFSMPESWQRERHDLRVRLVWHGFGLLQAGVWVAPHPVDVPAVLAGLGAEVERRVRGFRLAPLPAAEAAAMVAEAYDLPGLAARYEAFRQRWQSFEAAGCPDPLAARVLLAADWLQTVREDPRLPAGLLPAGWPASAAERLFRAVAGQLDGPAASRLATDVERLPAGG